MPPYRCLALDEFRMDQRKSFPCPCSKPVKSTWKPNAFSQREIGKDVFHKYVAGTILKTPVKVSKNSTTYYRYVYSIRIL